MKPVPPSPYAVAVDAAIAELDAEKMFGQLQLMCAEVNAIYEAEHGGKESDGKAQLVKMNNDDVNLSQNQGRLSDSRVPSGRMMNVARACKLTSTPRPKSLSDMCMETVSPDLSPIDYYSSQQLIIRRRSVSSSEEEGEEEQPCMFIGRENFRYRQWKSFPNLRQPQQLNRGSDYKFRNDRSQPSDMVFSRRPLNKRRSTEILPDHAVKRRSYSELKDEDEPRVELLEKSAIPLELGNVSIEVLGNQPIQPLLENQPILQQSSNPQELLSVEELSSIQKLSTELEFVSQPNAKESPSDQQLPTESEPENQSNVLELSADSESGTEANVQDLSNVQNNSELERQLNKVHSAYRPLIGEIVFTILENLIDQVKEAVKQRIVEGNVNQVLQRLAEEAMEADVEHMVQQIIKGKQNQIVKRSHYGIIPLLIVAFQNVVPCIQSKVQEQESDNMPEDVELIVQVAVDVVVGAIRKQAEQVLIESSVVVIEQSSDSDGEPLAQLLVNVQSNKESVVSRKCLRHYDPAYDDTILDKMQMTSIQSLQQYFKDKLSEAICLVVCQKIGFNAPLPLAEFNSIDWSHVCKYTDDDLMSGTLMTLDEMKQVKRRWNIPYCHPGPMLDKGTRTKGWYYLDGILQKVQLKGKRSFHYIVRWVGYEDEFNTIESKASLQQTPALDLFELKEKGYATASRAGASILRRSERLTELKRNEAVRSKQMNELGRLLQGEIDAGRYMSTVGFIHPETAADAMRLQFKFFEEQFLPYLNSLNTPGFAMGNKVVGSVFCNIGHTKELQDLEAKCTLKPTEICTLIWNGLAVAEKSASNKGSHTHVSFIVMTQHDRTQKASGKQMDMHMCVYTVRKESRFVKKAVFFDPAPRCLSWPMPRYLERLQSPKIETLTRRYGNESRNEDCFYQCLNYIAALHSGKIAINGTEFLVRAHVDKK